MNTVLQIRIFARVAQLRNFTMAAKELKIAPASISRGVSQLEMRLHVRVFIRTTREVSLTTAGARFLESIREFLETYRNLEEKLTNASPKIYRSIPVASWQKWDPILAMRCLVELAHCGSLSQAAETLSLSRRSLEQQIASMEARFGAPLLIRLGSHISLTAIGNQYLDEIRHVIIEFERIDLNPFGGQKPAGIHAATTHATASQIHSASTGNNEAVFWWSDMDAAEEEIARACFEQGYNEIFFESRHPRFCKKTGVVEGEYSDPGILRAWKMFRLGWVARRHTSN